MKDTIWIQTSAKKEKEKERHNVLRDYIGNINLVTLFKCYENTCR